MLAMKRQGLRYVRYADDISIYSLFGLIPRFLGRFRFRNVR